MYRRRNPLRALSGGIFLIGLAFAFILSDRLGGDFFLSILFVALAFSALFGSISTLNPRSLYGGLQGFVWLFGLAILFLPGVGFWPWILVLCGISIILGVLIRPIMAGLLGLGFLGVANMANRQPQQPYYQPPPPQQPYQSYQQGYSPQETYQEGGQQYQYPPEPRAQNQQPQYEQPQAQYPQEMPPQQQ